MEAIKNMTVAYDPKALAEAAKEKGLDNAEKVLGDAMEVIVEWYKKSAELSPTPFDNMGVLALGPVTEALKALIDKIDGQVG